MKRKNIVGLIAIVAIVAAVIFAGCIEEETPVSIPTPTPVSPTSSFEIEYPVTAYWETKYGSFKVTLYEDGSASGKAPEEGDFYGEWEIKEKTNSKIEYRVGFRYGTHSRAMYFVLFSNHDAILDPRLDPILGYWR